MGFNEMEKSELAAMKKQWDDEYNSFKAKGLKLNMARGKPAPEQLELSMDFLMFLTARAVLSAKMVMITETTEFLKVFRRQEKCFQR